MCFSTARLVSTSESAIAALLLPCAISARTSRSRGVSSASGERSIARLARDERVDELRVDDRAARADRLDRRRAARQVVDALLEQVAAAVGSRLEQRERVARLGVLAEDDDADLGVRLAQPIGDADALVGVRRRHPDVRERRRRAARARSPPAARAGRRTRRRPRRRARAREAAGFPDARSGCPRRRRRARSSRPKSTRPPNLPNQGGARGNVAGDEAHERRRKSPRRAGRRPPAFDGHRAPCSLRRRGGSDRDRL